MLIKIGDAWVDPQEIAAFFPTADLPSTPKIGIILRSGGNVWAEATMDEAEAALIDAGYIENPYPEQEEVPTLSVPEMQELTALYDVGYEWLARDGRPNAKGCTLFAFAAKPTRTGDIWQSASSTRSVNAPFDFITADDAEPWSIPYLMLDARSQA